MNPFSEFFGKDYSFSGGVLRFCYVLDFEIRLNLLETLVAL